MDDHELGPLRASLEAYNLAAHAAEDARIQMQALATALSGARGSAHEELKSMHQLLLETVRRTEITAAMARGVLGVVAAMRGMDQKIQAPHLPYTPPEGEDYIGT